MTDIHEDHDYTRDEWWTAPVARCPAAGRYRLSHSPPGGRHRGPPSGMAMMWGAERRDDQPVGVGQAAGAAGIEAALTEGEGMMEANPVTGNLECPVAAWRKEPGMRNWLYPEQAVSMLWSCTVPGCQGGQFIEDSQGRADHEARFGHPPVAGRPLAPVMGVGE